MSSPRPPLSPLAPLALLLALVSMAAAAPLQAKPAKDQAPVFEGTSQVVSVEVPVNVVDREGQPVRGLTADDFEIWDGNEKQKASSFEVVDLKALEAAREVASPGAVQRLPELDSGARRHFLFLFDLTFSTPTSLLRARLAARDFVLRELHPSDLAGVAT